MRICIHTDEAHRLLPNHFVPVSHALEVAKDPRTQRLVVGKTGVFSRSFKTPRMRITSRQARVLLCRLICTSEKR